MDRRELPRKKQNAPRSRGAQNNPIPGGTEPHGSTVAHFGAVGVVMHEASTPYATPPKAWCRLGGRRAAWCQGWLASVGRGGSSVCVCARGSSEQEIGPALHRRLKARHVRQRRSSPLRRPKPETVRAAPRMQSVKGGPCARHLHADGSATTALSMTSSAAPLLLSFLSYVTRV